MRQANEERGEVNLVVGDKTYVLRLTNQAICETQARTGKTWGVLLRSMDEMDYIAYRDVLNVTLRAYHAKEFPNLVAVSGLIDDASMPRVTQALSKLFELNAAQANKVNEEVKAAENPTAAAMPSTGEPLSSELDASA